MIRWTRIAGLTVALFALLATGAQASSPYSRATLVRCDKDANEAVFQGRVLRYKRSAKMRLRFTLQAWTPDEPRWRRVAADGFGEWITAPPGLTRYTYDKTVESLLAPARYRTVISFRWRDGRGRTIRSERATSPACRQPDSRPDLVVSDVRVQPRGYVAVIANRGREAAGTFGVDFLRAGAPLGSVDVIGLAPDSTVDVFLPAPQCQPGEQIEAVVDPRSEVDEADEENDSLAVTC
jgi:hypothetical protein